MLTKFASNSTWIAIDRLVFGLISFYCLALIARNYEPNFFGLFSLGVSLSAIFSTVQFFGLQPLITKKIALDISITNSLLKKSAILMLIITIGLILLFSLYITLNFEASDMMMLLIIISSNFLNFSKLLNFYFEAKMQAHLSSISNIFGSLAMLIFTTLFVIYGLDGFYLSTIFLIMNLISTLIVLLFFFKFPTLKIQKPSNISYKSLIEESLLIFLCFLFMAIIIHMDRLIIEKFLGLEQLGIYSASVILLRGFMSISEATSRALLPYLSRYVQKNDEHFFMKVYYSIYFYLGVLISVVVYLYADTVLGFIYPNLNYENLIFIKIYSFGAIFIFFDNSQWAWYINKGFLREAALRLFFGMIIALTLNIALTPILGLTGSAVAFLISSFFIGFISNAFFRATKENLNYQIQSLYLPVHFVKNYFFKK